MDLHKRWRDELRAAGSCFHKPMLNPIFGLDEWHVASVSFHLLLFAVH